MASTVGEIGQFVVGGIHGRSLHLPGLVSNTHRTAHVLRGLPVYRKLPNVELHAFAADHDATVAVYVRILVPSLTEGELLRSASGF